MIYNIWQNIDEKDIRSNNRLLILPYEIPYKYMLENKDGFLSINFYYFSDGVGHQINNKEITLGAEPIKIICKKNSKQISTIITPISNEDDLNSDLIKIIKQLKKTSNKSILVKNISNHLFLIQFFNYLTSKLKK